MKKSTTYLDPKIVGRTVLTHLTSCDKQYSSFHLETITHVLQKAWSTIYFINLANSQDTLNLVAKIAHFPDQTSPEISWQSEELLLRGQDEFNVISHIYNHFSKNPDPALTAIRPRLFIPEINAIVMDYASGTTLYDECITLPLLINEQKRRQAEELFHSAGRWLREFHQIPIQKSSDEHTFGPADSFSNLQKRAKNLRDLGIKFKNQPRWNKAVDILENISGNPKVRVHNDFHLRNILVLSKKRVLGYDTAMARVDDPCLDLGNFIADLKTRRTLILSLGILPLPDTIKRLNNSFLNGYYGKRIIPLLSLTLYEGQFILQKWRENIEKIQTTFTGSSTVIGNRIQDMIVNPTYHRIFNQWLDSVHRNASNKGAF